MRICLVLFTGISCISGQTEYRLDAFQTDGKDGRWVNRGGGWMGITGDHVWHKNVPMWWDDFSGPTGFYKISIIAGIECDGSPDYAIKVGSETVCSGKYPDGGSGCDDCGVIQRTLNCSGEHLVNNGDKITMLGSGVYPCGDHGAYTRTKGLVFKLVGSLNDDTPPSNPANLKVTRESNTSISLSWDASADNESGVKHYVIYLDGTPKATSQSNTGTISGLNRATIYINITVAAVNNAGQESGHSNAVGATTTDKPVEDGTFYFSASEGTMSGGMTASARAGSLAGQAISGNTGNADSPLGTDSKVEFSLDLGAGEWYIWARFNASADNANSFWVQVDGGAAKQFGQTTSFNTWMWDQNNGAAVSLGTLSEGTHTLTITCREAGAFMDKICLTPESNYIPNDEAAVGGETAISPYRIGYLAPGRDANAFTHRFCVKGRKTGIIGPGAQKTLPAGLYILKSGNSNRKKLLIE